MGERRWSDREREQLCGSKRRYASETTAKAALRAAQRGRAMKKDRMSVYRCPVCRAFHYGHLQKRIG